MPIKTSNPDKEQIISLVKRLLGRSGLTIDHAVARMQAQGCDITRSAFENRFTTRVDQKPNVEPDWLLALMATFTLRLTDSERCTAAEAIELARLARLPIDQFTALERFSPRRSSPRHMAVTSRPWAWSQSTKTGQLASGSRWFNTRKNSMPFFELLA